MTEQTLLPPVTTDAAAFDRRKQLVMQAVELYYQYLLIYVRRFVSHHDAEDVVQELLKYALLHIPEDRICSLPFLRRKAYYLVVDQSRKRQRIGVAPQVEDLDALHELPAPTHHEAIFSIENENRLQQTFWTEFPIELTEGQRRALWLYGRHGLTLEEISEETGVARSTVFEWIKIGRERLHAAMDAQN